MRKFVAAYLAVVLACFLLLGDFSYLFAVDTKTVSFPLLPSKIVTFDGDIVVINLPGQEGVYSHVGSSNNKYLIDGDLELKGPYETYPDYVQKEIITYSHSEFPQWMTLTGSEKDEVYLVDWLATNEVEQESGRLFFYEWFENKVVKVRVYDIRNKVVISEFVLDGYVKQIISDRILSFVSPEKEIRFFDYIEQCYLTECDKRILYDYHKQVVVTDTQIINLKTNERYPLPEVVTRYWRNDDMDSGCHVQDNYFVIFYHKLNPDVDKYRFHILDEKGSLIREFKELVGTWYEFGRDYARGLNTVRDESGIYTKSMFVFDIHSDEILLDIPHELDAQYSWHTRTIYGRYIILRTAKWMDIYDIPERKLLNRYPIPSYSSMVVSGNEIFVKDLASEHNISCEWDEREMYKLDEDLALDYDNPIPCYNCEYDDLYEKCFLRAYLQIVTTIDNETVNVDIKLHKNPYIRNESMWDINFGEDELFSKKFYAIKREKLYYFGRKGYLYVFDFFTSKRYVYTYENFDSIEIPKDVLENKIVCYSKIEQIAENEKCLAFALDEHNLVYINKESRYSRVDHYPEGFVAVHVFDGGYGLDGRIVLENGDSIEMPSKILDIYKNQVFYKLPCEDEKKEVESEIFYPCEIYYSYNIETSVTQRVMDFASDSPTIVSDFISSKSVFLPKKNLLSYDFMDNSMSYIQSEFPLDIGSIRAGKDWIDAADYDITRPDSIVRYTPCPTFSIEMIYKDGNKVKFNLTATRGDGYSSPLSGKAYVLPWGVKNLEPRKNESLEPMNPILIKFDKSSIVEFNSLEFGESVVLEFDIPDAADALYNLWSYMDFETNSQFGEKLFCLNIESNGLLDTRKSVFDIDINPGGRMLFWGRSIYDTINRASVSMYWYR